MLGLIKHNVQLFLTKIFYSFKKRDNKIWVFGEWFGERCGDNCAYFAYYLAKHHPNYNLYWVFKNKSIIKDLPQGVTALEMDSKECVNILKKAGLVFVCHGMADLTSTFSLYYSGALVVNFWHGVPWKKIHSDMYTNPLQRLYCKVTTKLFGEEYYLSSSTEFDKVIQSAFACKDNKIIKAGYPRNCIFYHSEAINKAKEELLSLCRIINEGNQEIPKIILYMPTFRDNTKALFSFEKSTYLKEFESLLTNWNAYIIEKSHFIDLHRGSIDKDSNNRIIHIDNFPSQKLLAAADVLITDYSSCFFDYLILDRPIIHFLYDFNSYLNTDRGLYYKVDQVLCGDVVYEEKELICKLVDNLKDPSRYHELRSKRKSSYINYESSDSCTLIYKTICQLLH